MIKITNKWMSKAEALRAAETKDYFTTLSGGKLYIVAQEASSAAGKVRFAYVEQDVNGAVINKGITYLEGLTRKVKNVVREGQTQKITIPANVDNSQATGKHIVLSVTLSANKRKKRFLKAYKLCKQASEVYGLTDVFSGILEQLQALDEYTAKCEAVKAQQAIEQAKAEAEAKAKAEEEVKKEEEKLKQIRSEYDTLCGFMPETQAFSLIEKKYGAEYMAKVF